MTLATVQNPRPLTSNIPLMLANFEAVRELCTLVEQFAQYAAQHHQRPQIPTVVHVQTLHLKRFIALVFDQRHNIRPLGLKLELSLKYEGDAADSIAFTRGYCRLEFIKFQPITDNQSNHSPLQ